jgi:hypothetical protein
VLSANGGEGRVEPKAQDLNNAVGVATVAWSMDAGLRFPACGAFRGQNKDPLPSNGSMELSSIILLFFLSFTFVILLCYFINSACISLFYCYIFICGYIPAAPKGLYLMNNSTTPNNPAQPIAAPAKDTSVGGAPVQPQKTAPVDLPPKTEPAVVPTPKI